jgi:hypothetical protein
MVGVLRCQRSVLSTRSNARKREDHCCHQHVKAVDPACSESPGDVQRSENSSGWFVLARHATQVFILLSVSNRPSGAEAQRDLARKVGRPYCGFSRSASDRLGRSGQTGPHVSCCQALVAGIPWGMPVVPFEAHDETARSVLERLILMNEQSNRVSSRNYWLLRCDSGWCFINVENVWGGGCR